MLGFPGGTLPPAEPPSSGDQEAALREPPADLPASIEIPGLGKIPSPHDFWRQWAPLAIEQHTLVPATVPGFRELCELASFKTQEAERIRRFGSGGKDGSERMKNYAKLSQRVDAALARFKLTAFGKPADGGKRKAVADNAWAALGRL